MLSIQSQEEYSRYLLYIFYEIVQLIVLIIDTNTFFLGAAERKSGKNGRTKDVFSKWAVQQCNQGRAVLLSRDWLFIHFGM